MRLKLASNRTAWSMRSTAEGHLQARDSSRLAWFALGTMRFLEAELGRLLQALLAARRRPHLAGQADLAEHDDLRRQRLR